MKHQTGHAKADGAFSAMDRMYRLQRHFYDATRKYYLLGRDRLLSEMPVKPGDAVLEVGCGTGRNLIVLAKCWPDAIFFGLDASSAMLETAGAKIARSGSSNIYLETALADDFDHRITFGREEKFDIVFFSYSISMIPTWIESIENALVNMKPGGKLYIVDFYDQRDLPSWSRKLLTWWLSQFHVNHWKGLIPHLESSEMRDRCDVRITPLFRRYSFIAELTLL